MKNNPLLKTLKDGDIVMFVHHTMGPMLGDMTPSKEIRYIARLSKTKFIPADEKCSVDWLEFESEILYSNQRQHPELLKQGVPYNCTAITETVPAGLLERMAEFHKLWKAEEYMYSDVELEHLREIALEKLK
jgi:hypothetical protein